MSATRLIVSAHWLDGAARSAAPLRRDTPAWTAWLEAPTSAHFAYPVFDAPCGPIVGQLTVCQERAQRGGTCWVIYRRWGGPRRKVFLGHASVVAQALCVAVTQVLRPL